MFNWFSISLLSEFLTESSEKQELSAAETLRGSQIQEKVKPDSNNKINVFTRQNSDERWRFSTPKAREKLETNEAWQEEGRLGRERSWEPTRT
jgi:hypothetical protein